MTQIAEPQVSTVSVLRTHRALVLALLGALVVVTTALILVIGNGGGGGVSIPSSSPRSVGFEAGPAAGTPSAVSEALGIERVRSGISLTTNLPAGPRVDEGPVAGTPSAVSAAIRGSTRTHSGLPSSLTTNVPAKTVPDAGPTSAAAVPQYVGNHGDPRRSPAQLKAAASAPIYQQAYERQTPGHRP